SIEDVGGITLVVVRPVRNGAQGGAGFKSTGRGEQGHQGDEAAGGAAVDADAPGVDAELSGQVAGAVNVVVQVFAAYMAVDGGAPVAAIAGAASVVDIEHGVAVVHQQVVEHILAVVAAPPLVHVLQ